MATDGRPKTVSDGNGFKPTAADIGLAEYARQVGRDESFIRQIRKAAEVAGKFGVNSELLDKTQHLAASFCQDVTYRKNSIPPCLAELVGGPPASAPRQERGTGLRPGCPVYLFLNPDLPQQLLMG